MPLLVVGATAIHYEVRRSPRVRRQRIIVTPHLVEVVAPQDATDDDIHTFVHRRRRWVYDQFEILREQAGVPAPARRFISGAKVPYRGRQMRLTVGHSSADHVVIEYRDGFVVWVPRGLPATERDARASAAFRSWFQDRLRRDVEKLVRRHSTRLDEAPRGMRIGEMKHLWGSCGRDRIIRLDWRLVFAPKPVLEYAVVHELCHLRHRSHSTEFWRLLRELLPDFETQRSWLARHERSLAAESW